MSHRGNTFGWNWRKNRQSNNPILLKERKDNVITCISGSDDVLAQYRLTPLSMKGRPTVINFDVGGENTSLKVDNTNLEIFFDDSRLDDICFASLGEITTPFDDVWNTLDSNNYTVNWILYTEALFPSMYNEFYTSSLQRMGYDNVYWRTLRGLETADPTPKSPPGTRNAVGSKIDNSFGVGEISQSCWLLDAPDNFLIRDKPAYTFHDVAAALPDGTMPLKAHSGSSGELQNNYFFAFPSRPWSNVHGSPDESKAMTERDKIISLFPGALYSRKHMIHIPHSAVAPSGIRIPQINSGHMPKSLSDSLQIDYFDSSVYWLDLYAGEAYWDAPANAGIIVQSGKVGTNEFKSYASEPWFTNYADFSYNLKLIAKDFSIVPEFRISQHVEDYLSYGLFNEGKTDTF